MEIQDRPGDPASRLTPGERIRILRERRRMRRNELAPIVGVSAKQLGRYERGEGSPQGVTLRRLALALETTADYLLALVDDPRLPENALTTRASSNGLVQGQAA